MNDDVKSFVLYTEQNEVIKSLSDEDVGKLMKAIYNYVSTGEWADLGGMLNVIAIPFKQQLDRNINKWQEERRKRSEAGKKGMETRWGNNREYQSIANHNQDITNITKDNTVIEMELTGDEINEMSDEEFIKYLERGNKK